ncbi:MAG: RNA polymerase sigma-70 factor [Chitinophagaceae bacterium]
MKSSISISDHALIARWQQGDESSFDVLYRRYILKLVEILAHKTGDTQRAKELAQDVFLAIYLQKEKLSDIVHFKAYLLSIAKHKVFNYYRAKLLHEKHQQHIFHQPEVYVSLRTEEVLENKELARIISEKIEQLPPKCREIFRLSREERLSYRKIAQRMSISENTVDQHIRKALNIIRSTLNEYNSSIIIALVFIFL